MVAARRRESILALASVLAVLALVGPRLWIEPIVGVADNGDFLRLMCRAGLAYPEGLAWSEQYFYWIQRSFVVGTPPAGCMPYVTSAHLFVDAAIRLSHLCSGGSGRFDLRLMGLVHAAVLAAAFTGILFATRCWRLPARVSLCSLLAVVFGDIGYVAYFNSFYCEPASLLFFLTTSAAFLLALSLRERAGVTAPLAVGAFHASALLFLASKPQNYAMSLPLLLPAAFLLHGERRRSVRVVAIVGLLALPTTSLALFQTVDRAFARSQLYDVVFLDVVGHSPDPDRDLERLGLDGSFRKYLGTSAWQDRSVLVDPEFRQSFDRITYVSVLRLYLADPRLFLDDLRRTAQGALDVRLSGKVGHREKASGAPALAQSSSFSAWSILREAAFPRRLWFLLVFGALNLAAAAIKWTCFDRSRFDRGASVLHLWVVATGALAFLGVTIGGGSFDDRHLFLFDVSFDACCIFLPMYGLGLSSRAWFDSGS